jgi:hypothetical protein
MKKTKRSGAKGLYRDGGHLVIREGARFPDQCVICNKLCDGTSVDFTFGRTQSHYVEVAAVEAVARAASDLLKGGRYTGPVQAAIPLCTWHRSRRLLLIGCGVAVAAVAAGFLLVRYAIGGAAEFDVLQISLASVIAIAAVVVGLTVAWVGLVERTKVWFKPVKYHDRFVWVKGAGLGFLRELTRIEDYHYKPGAADPHLSADELIRRAGRGDA